MKNKPMILMNDDMNEGIYAASGAGCYTTDAEFVGQTPFKNGEYHINIKAKHDADHNDRKTQWIHIVFNKPVTFQTCDNHDGTIVRGSGTNTLVIEKHENQSYNDSIGISKLVVTADVGLEIMNVYTTDF